MTCLVFNLNIYFSSNRKNCIIHCLFNLNINASSYIEKMYYALQGVPEQKLRSHLGSFGVTGNLALQSMYTLSGNITQHISRWI